jgi:hypothetical protein
MAVYIANLSVNLNGNPAEHTVTIDMGSPQLYLAWGVITWIDPTAPFDRDNAVGIDIPKVDNQFWTDIRPIESEHLGPPVDFRFNLRETALHRFNRYVTFRLRAFHGLDLKAAGNGIILTDV